MCLWLCRLCVCVCVCGSCGCVLCCVLCVVVVLVVEVRGCPLRSGACGERRAEDTNNAQNLTTLTAHQGGRSLRSDACMFRETGQQWHMVRSENHEWLPHRRSSFRPHGLPVGKQARHRGRPVRVEVAHGVAWQSAAAGTAGHHGVSKSYQCRSLV